MRFLLVFLVIGMSSFAQRDSAIAIPMLGVHFSAQLPFGDLANRFGQSFSAGGSFLYKTNTNWLQNSDGFVTDNEGYPANLRITERGLATQLVGGRIFRVFGSNPNSGLCITIGVGYLQHKVHIYDAQQRVASLSGDLKKGYDRLTSGISLSQFVGYMYLGKKRLSNFYAGFEFYEAFTQSVRQLNYSTASPDTENRNDILAGFRVGWILPLYKKLPADYYLY